MKTLIVTLATLIGCQPESRLIGRAVAEETDSGPSASPAPTGTSAQGVVPGQIN